jgi:hypothetical protein
MLLCPQMPWNLALTLSPYALKSFLFPEYGNFIQMETLLWKVIFLHNQLMWSL